MAQRFSANRLKRFALPSPDAARIVRQRSIRAPFGAALRTFRYTLLTLKAAMGRTVRARASAMACQAASVFHFCSCADSVWKRCTA